MKQIALSEIKDDLSRFLREAEGEEIIITRSGRSRKSSAAGSGR